jgi:hypothetical protein
MSTDSQNGATVVQQTKFIVPDISIKELLDAIPWVSNTLSSQSRGDLMSLLFSAHCFKRSAVKSASYMYVLSLSDATWRVLIQQQCRGSDWRRMRI